MEEWHGAMSRLALSLIFAAVPLAACGDHGEAPSTPAASVGPPGYADMVANPANHKGEQVEFKVSLVVGKALLPTGETATTAEQSWEDPPRYEAFSRVSRLGFNEGNGLCLRGDERRPYAAL